MPRRIVRTTRRIQYNEDGEPIETVVSSTQERPALSPGDATQETEVYEPERGLERVAYTYSTPAATTRRVVRTEILDPQEWGQTLRTITQRQMQILRDFELRLASVEDATRAREGTFERATWWALWGVLMLILGAALVVILLLIFTGLPR